MMALAVAHEVWKPLPLWPAGTVGWLAAILLWQHLIPRQRLPVALLLAIGGLGLAWGAARRQPGLVLQALSQNSSLIAMLVAVTFLQLVTLADGAGEEALPRGRRALGRTLLGVHLLGGVINISTVMIMGDRIASGMRLTREQVMVLSRGFSSAAFWSPFWAAMATALTFAPGARFLNLFAVGVPFAMLALFISWRELTSEACGRGEGFQGYPMHLQALAVPVGLALGVIVVHETIPGWSVLTGVTVLAPLASVALLIARGGPGEALQRLGRHVVTRLPAMAGELTLFLAAAVFATGLGAVLAAVGPGLPFQRFGGFEAGIVLVLMVSLSVVGIHPVISVAMASAWLSPVHPDQNLLAMVFLMAWGIGVTCNPLSGLSLSLQGRYGIPGRQFLRWNLGYGIKMAAAGTLVLWLYAAWTL